MTTEALDQTIEQQPPQPNDDVAGLKAKNAELLTELKALKQANRDRAAADAKAAEEKAAKREQDLAAKGNVDELRKAYDEKLAAADSKYGQLVERLVTKEIEAQLTTAIAAEGGNAKLLIPHLKHLVTGQLADDGSVSLTVTGLNGKQLDGTDTLTVAGLVKQLKADESFGGAFSATMAAGAGIKPTGGKATDNPWANNTRNVVNQGKLIETNPALAKVLMKEAGLSDFQISATFR